MGAHPSPAFALFLLCISGCGHHLKLPSSHDELKASRHAEQLFAVSFPVNLMMGESDLSSLEINVLLRSEGTSLLSERTLESAMEAAEVRKWNLVPQRQSASAWVRERLVWLNPAGSEIWVLAFVDREVPSEAMLAVVDSIASQYIDLAGLEEEARRQYAQAQHDTEAPQGRSERGRMSEAASERFDGWAARVESAAADLLNGNSKLSVPKYLLDEIQRGKIQNLTSRELAEGINNKSAYWARSDQRLVELKRLGPTQFQGGS